MLLLAGQVVYAVSLQTALPYFEQTRAKLQAEAEYEALSQLIDDTEGPVLLDEHMGMEVLAGRRIYIQPFEMTQLYTAGLWDSTPLLTSLEDRHITYVITDTDLQATRWPDDILAALERHYDRVGTFAGSTVYSR